MIKKTDLLFLSYGISYIACCCCNVSKLIRHVQVRNIGLCWLHEWNSTACSCHGDIATIKIVIWMHDFWYFDLIFDITSFINVTFDTRTTHLSHCSRQLFQHILEPDQHSNQQAKTSLWILFQLYLEPYNPINQIIQGYCIYAEGCCTIVKQTPKML